MGLTKEPADPGAGTGHKCLVCYGPFAPSKLKKSSWDDSSVPLLLDKHLSVIFVLRNLLEVPSERLHLFLTCLGAPERWIWICPRCHVAVRKAISVHEELLKVTRRFLQLKETIIGGIRGSCGREKGVGGEPWNQFGKLWITDQSRQFALTHDYGPFKNPFSSGDAQARQLGNGPGTAILWVEADPEPRTDEQFSDADAASSPVDPLQEEQEEPDADAIKIELEEEEEGGDFEPSMDSEPFQDELSHSGDDDASAQFPVGLRSRSGDEGDEDACEEESDFDEAKIVAGEGSYFAVTRTQKMLCLKCNSLSRSMQEFVRHMKLHKTSPYKCKVCKRIYPNKRAQYLHIYKYHPEVIDPKRRHSRRRPRKEQPKLRNIESDSSSSDVSDIDESKIEEGIHYTTTRTQKLKCLKCNDLSRSREAFIRHVKLHKTSLHKCSFCPRVYPNERTLRGHLLSDHPDSVFRKIDRRPRPVRKPIVNPVRSMAHKRKLSESKNLALSGTEEDNGKSGFTDESDFDEAKIRGGEGVYFSRCQILHLNKLRCAKCRVIQPTMEALLGHIKLHKTSPHKCKVCHRVYPNPRGARLHMLKYHRETLHDIAPRKSRDVATRTSSQVETPEQPKSPESIRMKVKDTVKSSGSDINDANNDLEDESDFDEEKVRSGEGVYFLKTLLTLRCLKCNDAHPTMESFVEHIKLHKTSPYHCEVCNRVYPNHRSARAHVIKYHNELAKNIKASKSNEDADDDIEDDSEESDFEEAKIREGKGVYFRETLSGKLKCLRCGDFHKTMEDFIEHIKLHKTSPFKCKVCKRVYPTKRTVRVHVLRYHRETVNDLAPRKPQKRKGTSQIDSDDDDSAEFDEDDDGKLKEGRDYVRTPFNLFKCLKCFDRSHTMTSLIKHFQLHKESQYKCDTCPRVFTGEAFLRKHMRMYHPRQNRAHVRRPGKQVNAKHRNLSTIDYRREVEMNPNCFEKCTLCDVTMSVKRIKTHMELWHSSGAVDPAASSNVINEESKTLDECSVSNSTMDGGDVGLLPSGDSEAFKGYDCPKCKKNFKTLESFTEHNELHKTSPFHCHVCLEVSTNDQLLSNHIWLSHNRKENVKDKLRRKVKPITKSGLIRCMKCLRCFSTDAIAEHKELHETSPYNCKFCGNVFVDEDRLRVHLGRFHRQLYERMKSINPKDPLNVKGTQMPGKEESSENQVSEEGTFEMENSGEDSGGEDDEMDDDEEWRPEDDDDEDKIRPSWKRTTRASGDLNIGAKASGVRYTCQFCRFYSFRAEFSEKLCEHLEECPGLKQPDSDSGNSRDFQELCCPVCQTFKCSVLNKTEFCEHLLTCNNDPESSEMEKELLSISHRLFECGTCPKKRYFRLDGFLEHYKRHALRINKLLCRICSRKYCDQEALINHWTNCHPKLMDATPVDERYTKDPGVPEVNWWCSICSEKFQNENERDAHLEINHPHDVPQKTHICPTCQNGYACPDELRLHNGTSHVKASVKRRRRLMSCDLCSQVCRNQSELEDHKRKKHKINLFICDICAAECNSAGNLKCHMQLHDEVRKHQCDECPQSFTTKQYLRHHKFREHTAADKRVNPLVCQYCDKLLSSPHYLRHHIKTVHEQQFTIFCHMCGFGALYESRMKKHMLIAHQIGEHKVWRCDVEGCDREYKSRTELETHKDRHQGAPRYPCDICGKEFYIRQHMNRHRQIHTNAESKPYFCEICGKRFPVRNYLYIHMKSHRKK